VSPSPYPLPFPFIYTSNSTTPQGQQQRESIVTLADGIKWKHKTGTLHNKEHGGYISTASSYLIIAPPNIINIIGNETFQMHDDPARLEEILDSNDGIFTDCFRWHQKAPAEEIIPGRFQVHALTHLMALWSTMQQDNLTQCPSLTYSDPAQTRPMQQTT
jgi:hypothetical protein